MADAFSVDPDALADALQRMREFVQHTESVVAEVNSLVAQLHQTWSGQSGGRSRRGAPALVARRSDDARSADTLEDCWHHRPAKLHRRDGGEYEPVVVS